MSLGHGQREKPEERQLGGEGDVLPRDPRSRGRRSLASAEGHRFGRGKIAFARLRIITAIPPIRS
jgi:hypothetical protein